MGTSTIRRTGALLTTMALVAGVAAATAAPASAQSCTYTFPDAGGTYPGGTVSSGDNLCGGPGDDVVAHMTGGVFSGGPGDDVVVEKEGGRFWGNNGKDYVEVHSGGTFVGGYAADAIGYQLGGTFEGGPGGDMIMYAFDGVFEGGDGSDYFEYALDSTITAAKAAGGPVPASVRNVFPRRSVSVNGPVIPPGLDGITMRGGPGIDGGINLFAGDIRGQLGEDIVVYAIGGEFRGGRHTDSVWNLVEAGDFRGGRGHDFVLWQFGGLYQGNKGQDALGVPGGEGGLWDGVFNGGPADDFANICDAGPGGAVKNVEALASVTCDV